MAHILLEKHFSSTHESSEICLTMGLFSPLKTGGDDLPTRFDVCLFRDGIELVDVMDLPLKVAEETFKALDILACTLLGLPVQYPDEEDDFGPHLPDESSYGDSIWAVMGNAQMKIGEAIQAVSSADGYYYRNEKSSRIFDSTQDEAVQTPLLVTTIYQDNPSNIASGDVLSMMENLLFFDYNYLRMSIDHDYVMEYELMWNEQEVNHAVMKPIMITVGVGMLVLGGLQCATGGGSVTGIPTMLFGLDMVTSNTIGHSVLDDALKFFLLGSMVLNNRTGTRKAGYILSKGFSFFQFTSDHLANLLLTQMTFMLVGGALTGGAGLRGFLRGAATEEGTRAGFLLGMTENMAGRTASFRGLLTFAAWTSGVS
ncbi:MAG: hypothetical protein P1Q69_19745, partial [Candidatus Thorarchaeota archaeon]|nr:hypothetical protein [Candidatus Thorarchaeota archaeon]